MEDFGFKVTDEEHEEYLRESPKLLGTNSDMPDSFKESFEKRYLHLNQVLAEEANDSDETSPKLVKKKTFHNKSLVEKKKEEDHAKQFKQKFMEALKRKFTVLAENEILMKSYLEEKRKLEYQIIRDNKKNEATQSMINQMYDTNKKEEVTAKPNYRFEKLEKKYPGLL